MNQTNTVMLAILVALGVVLVAGLVVIPAIHEAQAISQQGESSRLLSRSNPGQTRHSGTSLGCSPWDPRC